MKKIFIRLIVLVLALSMILGCVSGCTDDNTVDYDDFYIEPYTYQGTHIYNATLTEKDFIVNGKTDYILVTPEKPSDMMILATEEFSKFFKMATDISIPTISDGGLTHDADKKYISLGHTSLLASSGLEVDKSVLKKDGFRIVTVGNTIYIFGADDYGTTYAVYQFMRMYFNYECYTVKTIQIDKNVKNAKLYNFDVTDVPDFDLRRISSNVMETYNSTNAEQKLFARRLQTNDTMFPEMMRMCNADTLEPMGWGENQMDILAKNTFYYSGKEAPGHFADNPEWFSDNGDQWCFTAHGNKESYEVMVEKVSQAVYATLKYYNPTDYPRMNHISISIEDNDKGCTCQACVTLARANGGSNAAGHVIFLNRIAQNVRTWMAQPENAEYRRDDFYIQFLAYLHMTTPPTYYDESTGKYMPYSEEVVCDDMLMVDLANIDADYQQSVYAEQNEDYRKTTEGWAAITKNLKFYLYTQQLKCQLLIYDNFNMYRTEEMQYYASLAAEGFSQIYFEDNGGRAGSTATNAWDGLKYYLEARMSWDTSLDCAELTKNFFDAVYGPASSVMQLFFADMRMFNYKENLRTGLFCKNSVMNYVHLRFNWQPSVVWRWMNYCDEALALVESLKESDPENYALYCENIEMERMTPAYIALQFLSETLTVDQKTGLKNKLYDILEKYPTFGDLLVNHVIGKNTYYDEWLQTV